MLFWIFVGAMTLYMLTYIHHIVVRRQVFSVNTFIVLGVVAPLVLYLLNWSGQIETQRADMFYVLFIYLFVAGILYMLLEKKRPTAPAMLARSNRALPLWAVNVGLILLILLENLIATGHVAPALIGVDSHAKQAPILVYLTRASYAVVALDVVFFLIEKKARHLIWAGVVLLIPIITTSSRMLSVQSGSQAAALLLFLLTSGMSGAVGRLTKAKRIRLLMITGIVLVAAVLFLIYVGINRMNRYGTYALTYSEGIQYHGPGGEIMAWLYGYFVLPFNNLNLSIKHVAAEHNYFGLYSFAPVFFGILQFDNLFGLTNDYVQKIAMYITKAAMVPTGFWTFYYDFGAFSFVPIVAAFALVMFLRWMMLREGKNRYVFMMLYFYFAPQWLFMGFTNTVFDVTAAATALFVVLLSRYYLTGEQAPAKDNNMLGSKAADDP